VERNLLKAPQTYLLAGIYTIILLLSISQIKNYDVWWHLKTGEIIFNTGRIPHHDIYSYTKAGARWIDHEWLSQLVFYLSYRFFDLYGVVALRIAIVLASFYVAYRRHQLFLNGYSNAFAIMSIVVLAHVSWLARPVLFSFLFVPLALYVLDLYYLEGRKVLWALPLIMLLWANLHGSFVVGLLLILFYALGAVWRDREKALHLGKTLVASTAATLVNPNTYETLFYTLQYGASSVHSKYIVEWQSPGFHTFTAFEAFLLLSILVLGLSEKAEPLDILLLLAFTHLGLFAVRNLALYGFVAVPIVFKYGERALEKHSLPLKIPPGTMRRFALSFSIAFLVMGAGLFGYTHLKGSPLAGGPLIDESLIPVKAAEYLLENKDALKGRNLYNNYGWGGYLIWRLYPDYRVFIDGRADIYGDFIEEYQRVKVLEPGANEVLERYNVTLAVIPKGSRLDWYLQKEPSWERIYKDTIAVIYLKELHQGEAG